MLVAAKVDAENPQRAAQIVNAHPGVSPQLPAHPRLQPLVHDRHPARLEARARRNARGADAEEAGAESMRELPTLTLFKINMNLEMEKGTETLAAPGGRGGAARASSSRSPTSDRDIAVIRALQGPMQAVERPYDAAAEAIGMTTAQLLDHLQGMVDRKPAAPRRRDPLPPPRRLLGQRHGRLEGARGRDRRRSVRRWPPSAASPTATSARPTRTGPTASSRWPTAAPRKSATRSSTRSPSRPAWADDRATLYSSTEYKKIRLHYFTPDYAEWEASRL